MFNEHPVKAGSQIYPIFALIYFQYNIVQDHYIHNNFRNICNHFMMNLILDAFESDAESGNNENFGQTSPGGEHHHLMLKTQH